MSEFRQIDPYELQGNVMDMIVNGWMLIGAKSGGRVNMMTASWGGMGVMWGKPAAFVFIRPQRFTKGLVDAADGFSCTFYGEEYRPQLTLCGTKSGRDIDKIEACGFEVAEEEGIPYFTQAKTVLLCEKLYRQPLDPACFIAQELKTTHYPGKDYHDFYVAWIKKVLVK